MIKIKAVMPDKAMLRSVLDSREKMLSKYLSKDAVIYVDAIKRGPDELDCNTDEAFAVSEMVKEAIQAEKDGFDAFVIYCFSDVGIDAIRENVRIPVIGPGETSLSVAGMLCNRFAVITTENRNIARTYRRLMKNSIAREKMTSVRALDIPITDLRKDTSITQNYLQSVCSRIKEDEYADGIILGCLGMAQYGEQVESSLGIKVIDPAAVSIAYAEMSVRIGLNHKELVYPHFTDMAQFT